MFVSEARSPPYNEARERCSNQCRLLALPTNFRLENKVERLAWDKD
jgi:hypothetical protein